MDWHRVVAGAAVMGVLAGCHDPVVNSAGRQRSQRVVAAPPSSVVSSSGRAALPRAPAEIEHVADLGRQSFSWHAAHAPDGRLFMAAHDGEVLLVTPTRKSLGKVTTTVGTENFSMGALSWVDAGPRAGTLAVVVSAVTPEPIRRIYELVHVDSAGRELERRTLGQASQMFMIDDGVVLVEGRAMKLHGLDGSTVSLAPASESVGRVGSLDGDTFWASTAMTRSVRLFDRATGGPVSQHLSVPGPVLGRSAEGDLVSAGPSEDLAWLVAGWTSKSGVSEMVTLPDQGSLSPDDAEAATDGDGLVAFAFGLGTATGLERVVFFDRAGETVTWEPDGEPRPIAWWLSFEHGVAVFLVHRCGDHPTREVVAIASDGSVKARRPTRGRSRLRSLGRSSQGVLLLDSGIAWRCPETSGGGVGSRLGPDMLYAMPL